MHKWKKLVKPHNTDLRQLFPFIPLINISLHFWIPLSSSIKLAFLRASRSRHSRRETVKPEMHSWLLLWQDLFTASIKHSSSITKCCMWEEFLIIQCQCLTALNISCQRIIFFFSFSNSFRSLFDGFMNSLQETDGSHNSELFSQPIMWAIFFSSSRSPLQINLNEATSSMPHSLHTDAAVSSAACWSSTQTEMHGAQRRAAEQAALLKSDRKAELTQLGGRQTESTEWCWAETGVRLVRNPFLPDSKGLFVVVFRRKKRKNVAPPIYFQRMNFHLANYLLCLLSTGIFHPQWHLLAKAKVFQKTCRKPNAS